MVMGMKMMKWSITNPAHHSTTSHNTSEHHNISISITTSQHHNITTSQHHNITTSQHHNITTITTQHIITTHHRHHRHHRHQTSPHSTSPFNKKQHLMIIIYEDEDTDVGYHSGGTAARTDADTDAETGGRGRARSVKDDYEEGDEDYDDEATDYFGAPHDSDGEGQEEEEFDDHQEEEGSPTQTRPAFARGSSVPSLTPQPSASPRITSNNPRSLTHTQSQSGKLRVPHTTNINNTNPIRKNTLTASSPSLFGSGNDEKNTELVEAARGTTSVPNTKQKETLKKIARGVQPVDPSYLKDYGPVPAGFRPSTLAAQLELGKNHPSAYVEPKLNTSGLLYEDLLLDVKKRRLRKHFWKNTFKVTLVGARGIPLPGSATTALSRRIRICLFDGVNFLSNVHTINGVWEKDSPKTWRFPDKAGMFLQRTGENAFLVRTHLNDPQLSLLFELCVVFKKKTKGQATDSETGELCCGWCRLPLFQSTTAPVSSAIGAKDEKGTKDTKKGPKEGTTASRPASAGRPSSGGGGDKLLEFRTYEMPLQDPSEQATPAAQKKGLFRDLFNKAQGPVLNIKLSSLARTENNSAAAVPLIRLYREMQLDALVRSVSPHPLFAGYSAGPRALAIFPRMLDVLDYIELLIGVWDARARSFTRSQRSDKEHAKKEFCSAVEQVWPFMHLFEASNVHHHMLLTEQAVQTRMDAAQKFLTQTPLATLVQNQDAFVFKPFNVSEITYTPLDTDYTKYAYT